MINDVRKIISRYFKFQFAIQTFRSKKKFLDERC